MLQRNVSKTVGCTVAFSYGEDIGLDQQNNMIARRFTDGVLKTPGYTTLPGKYAWYGRPDIANMRECLEMVDRSKTNKILKAVLFTGHGDSSGNALLLNGKKEFKTSTEEHTQTFVCPKAFRDIPANYAILARQSCLIVEDIRDKPLGAVVPNPLKNLRLVVLSGCYMNKGGLATSFVNCGARAVVTLGSDNLNANCAVTYMDGYQPNARSKPRIPAFTECLKKGATVPVAMDSALLAANTQRGENTEPSPYVKGDFKHNIFGNPATVLTP